MWNLVPTFQRVNSSKGNKLTDLDKYFDNFCKVQYSALSVSFKPFQRLILEDYWTLGKNIFDSNNKLATKNSFINSIRETIVPLYQIAYNHGYDLWVNDVYNINVPEMHNHY
jgi:hypothetical protein